MKIYSKMLLMTLLCLFSAPLVMADDCTIDSPPEIVKASKYPKAKIKKEKHRRSEEIDLADQTNIRFEWSGCTDTIEQTVTFTAKKLRPIGNTIFWLDWAQEELNKVSFSEGADISEVVTTPAAPLKKTKFKIEGKLASAFVCADKATVEKPCPEYPPGWFEVKLTERPNDITMRFHSERPN